MCQCHIMELDEEEEVAAAPPAAGVVESNGDDLELPPCADAPLICDGDYVVLEQATDKSALVAVTRDACVSSRGRTPLV